jgi:hypothetical protein
VVEAELVGPRQWIVEFAAIAGGDVPYGEPAPTDQYSARFLVQAGLVGHVHLNMLAEDDLEGGVGEGQFGDVCSTNGNPLVQPQQVD